MFATKKATRISEWESNQSFDKSKGEYIPLDCDAWLDAHKVREEGKKRGKRNQPGSDETLNDTMYNKIEAWIRKCALDCKEEVTSYLIGEINHLNDLKSLWEKENPEIKIDSLADQRCNDLKSITDENLSDLDKQRAEYEEAARDLKKFRQDNELSRVAHYPNSPIAHWLWIASAAGIESFFSANLLGSVSRGGVIEGWIVALVLTFVNILLGIGAGRIGRFINYKGFFIRLFAFCFSLVCTGVVLIWNNIAGHVRDIYVNAEKTGQLEAIDEAFKTAYGKMLEHPLPWESIQSAGLAVIGIFVFGLTVYKMYKADDPFPGYGSKHRKEQQLLKRYQYNLNEAREYLESERNQSIVEIEEIRDRYELDRPNWANTLQKLKAVVSDYPANLRQYNTNLAYLIAAYRDANLDARTSPPPPFFNKVPTIDEDEFQLSNLEIPDPPEWGDILNKSKIGLDRVEETYKQNLNRFQMLDHVVEDYEEKNHETKNSS